MQDGEFRVGSHVPAEMVQHPLSKCTKALCPDLPDDLVRLIISHCDRKGLRAAHMVDKTWQNAVKERVKKLAPPTFSKKHLDCFPFVSLNFLHCVDYQSDSFCVISEHMPF